MSQNKTIQLVATVVLIAVAVIIAVILFSRNGTINSYQDCVNAGYPVLESYPEQCRTPDGKSFTKPFDVGDSVTYMGKVVCLPHKNTSGPQTLECALGLLTNDGKYHALSDENQLILSVNVNDTVQVYGTIIKNTSSIYDIVDTVEVTSITEL